MADTRITQERNASLTYVDNWAPRLTTAYPGSTVTIASATGSVTGGAVVSAVTGTGTSITFHLVTSAVVPPAEVVLTLTATLSNGDVDVRDLTVGVV
jgi:hypothetical protein